MSRLIVMVLMVMVAGHAAGQGEDKKVAREREMARRLQSQVQKLEGEKAQLQQQNAELVGKAAELEKRTKANAGLQRQIGEARRREEAQAVELKATKDALAQAHGKIADLESSVATLRKELSESVAEGKRLGSELATSLAQQEQQRQVIGRQAQSLLEAGERNQKLVDLNKELVNLYQRKGVMDALLQKEPLTQIKDVRVNALAQDYHERVDALRQERPEPR
jgi:chromosome segregation ATPase